MVRWNRDPYGSSGETAKRRVKLLMLKDDMIHAISKYMEIEKDRVQLLMDTGTEVLSGGSRERVGVLHANIPIRSISNKGLF